MSQGGFFSFRTFLSNDIIKTVYALGMALITIAGAALMAIGVVALSDDSIAGMAAFGGAVQSLAAGLTLLFLGNLFWRLMCEGWILLFSVHEMLAAIERKVVSAEDKTDFSEFIFKQLQASDQNAEQRHGEMLAALRAPRPAPQQVERLPQR